MSPDRVNRILRFTFVHEYGIYLFNYLVVVEERVCDPEVGRIDLRNRKTRMQP